MRKGCDHLVLDLEPGKALQYLGNLSEAAFTVKLQGEPPLHIGEGESKFTLVVHRPPKKADLLRSTSLALGEAYMNKDIEVEGDLFAALNLVLSQMDKFSVDASALKKLLNSSTSMKNQKKEVTSHYNIGNDFYALWLGNTMNYSCAYFKHEEDTLDQAQENKAHHILAKLNLQEGMHLLDIGCGWGGLLLEAAKSYGVSGVGITLSEEQARGFQEKIEQHGLQGQLEVKVMDYRDLGKSGMTFDRVVSVGMLEHVGRKNYGLFLDQVDAVLNPQGLCLLHYISALKEHPGDPWIKKYIFPGGMIPSLREIMQLCAEHRFYTLDVESLRRHYVKTLLCWRENYLQSLDQISTMFDEKFIRMWELYLCSCAASFNQGVIDLHQILFSKGAVNHLPLTRQRYL